MAKERSTMRQRAGKAAVEHASPAAEATEAEPATLWDQINFYVAQHMGLVWCIAGVVLLCFGYDKEWMHNTTLCLLSLGLCLVGMFFHEFRPFNAQQVYEEQQQQQKAASEAAQ
ncbi:hypothetical protein COO60DRAFT_866445 [Scenedesmus sp. NREL 46B-D3]|nr:hypothetical protein COO60DRAFT_866445 [Scenedesmus sp. NREL 46B-D3]